MRDEPMRTCSAWPRITAALLFGVLLAAARPARAQGAGITAVTLRQYLAGAPSTIVAPFTIPITAVVCNQSLPVTTLHSASWDDPDNPGKACVYVDPGTGPLFAKVAGALEVTLTNLAGALESGESNRAPFLRPPAAPVNLKVVR